MSRTPSLPGWDSQKGTSQLESFQTLARISFLPAGASLAQLPGLTPKRLQLTKAETHPIQTKRLPFTQLTGQLGMDGWEEGPQSSLLLAWEPGRYPQRGQKGRPEVGGEQQDNSAPGATNTCSKTRVPWSVPPRPRILRVGATAEKLAGRSCDFSPEHHPVPAEPW